MNTIDGVTHKKIDGEEARRELAKLVQAFVCSAEGVPEPVVFASLGEVVAIWALGYPPAGREQQLQQFIVAVRDALKVQTNTIVGMTKTTEIGDEYAVREMERLRREWACSVEGVTEPVVAAALAEIVAMWTLGYSSHDSESHLQRFNNYARAMMDKKHQRDVEDRERATLQ